jgi:hypothetical protein
MEYISAKKVKQSFLNDIEILISLKKDFEKNILEKRSEFFINSGGCQNCHGKRKRLKTIRESNNEKQQLAVVDKECEFCKDVNLNLLNYKYLDYYERAEFLRPITKPFDNRIFYIKNEVAKIEKKLDNIAMNSRVQILRGKHKGKFGIVSSPPVYGLKNQKYKIVLEDKTIASFKKNSFDLVFLFDSF